MEPENLQALAAAWADRALEAERLGRLPDATVADLRDLGLTHLLLPRHWAGREADVAELLDVVRQLARGCMSSAWCAGIFAEHPWVLAHFERRAQEDVWAAGEDPFIVLSNAPTATVAPCDGGFRLSGQWRFASGCDYAGWFILLAGWDDQRRFFLLPAGEVAIDHASWQVAGLRATGSKTVAVEDAFVPAHRAWDPTAPSPGLTPDLPPLFHQPVGATLGLAWRPWRWAAPKPPSTCSATAPAPASCTCRPRSKSRTPPPSWTWPRPSSLSTAPAYCYMKPAVSAAKPASAAAP